MFQIPEHPDKIQERWLPVVDREGYFVSDQGRVFSTKGKNPRVLKGYSTKAGYIMISFRNRKNKYVHEMVCEAFIGPRPQKHEVRHLNGKPYQNALANLVWGTPTENQMDRVDHGTSNRGERHWNSTLTPSQVAEIRAIRDAEKTPYHMLAKKFGVATMTAFNICKRNTWK